MWHYLLAIVIVLIIMLLIGRKVWRQRCVQFGSDQVLTFNKDDPPVNCRLGLASLKAKKLGWMRIHMPSTYRTLADRTIPDYDFTDALKLEELPPTLEDEVAGGVPIKHKPFIGYSLDSHVLPEGYNSY